MMAVLGGGKIANEIIFLPTEIQRDLPTGIQRDLPPKKSRWESVGKSRWISVGNEMPTDSSQRVGFARGSKNCSAGGRSAANPQKSQRDAGKCQRTFSASTKKLCFSDPLATEILPTKSRWLFFRWQRIPLPTSSVGKTHGSVGNGSVGNGQHWLFGFTIFSKLIMDFDAS